MAHFIKGKHLTNHLPAVLESDLHAIVDLCSVSLCDCRFRCISPTRFCYKTIVSQSVYAQFFTQVKNSWRSICSGAYHFSLPVRGCRHAGGGASEDDLELRGE